MLFSILLTALLLIACCYDVTSFRIPNGIPLALAALFLIKATMLGISPWPSHIGAALLIFGLGFAGFALGVIGGGDAKLMTALALWLGMTGLPSFLAITAIGGGVLALVLLTLRQGLLAVSPGGAVRQWRLFHPKAPVPYALPITLAALWLEWPMS